MFKDELKEYVANNPKMVKMRPAGDGIFVLKYAKSVFYDGTWNKYVEECRGSIVDEDFNLITYPFTKIYNYGIEKQAPVFADTDLVTAFRKVNGFMVALTYHNNDVLVSTTGSTDSPYVAMALEMIDRERYLRVCRQYPGQTFMFECVHPNDPHIIPETQGMYLLGWRLNTWDSVVHPDPGGLEIYAELFGTLPVESLSTTLAELTNLVKTVKHEGFVFYTANSVAAKIKSPYYLIKKFVARNPRTDKLMRADIKETIEEEYYPLIDHIQINIAEYTALDEQARLAWVREFLEKQ